MEKLCSSGCEGSHLFEKFMEQVNGRFDETYEDFVEKLLSTDGVKLEDKLNEITQGQPSMHKQLLQTTDKCDDTPCAKLVKDFRILLKVDDVMHGNITT